MQVKQVLLFHESEWMVPLDSSMSLVLCFGSKALLSRTSLVEKITASYPSADIVYCSSAGEIFDIEVNDESLSVVAMSFDTTITKAHSVNVEDFESSGLAGESLAGKLNRTGLKYVLVISDGSKVNGSELLKGFHQVLPHELPITGGLAGDGSRFESTLTGLNHLPSSGNIIAIGFYGDNFQVSHGSLGGWDSFGLERTVTKSCKNELFEIDGRSALSLYKEYLGKYADELPGSALMFPLSVKMGEDRLTRTILSIDTEKDSMVFAGDIPEGSNIRFMKANFDRLIDASGLAAKDAMTGFDVMQPQLALLISCVGRKLLLGNRIDEEVEVIRDIFGSKTVLSGFYSYGELSPLHQGSGCTLQNQTMTITCFGEIGN